MSACNSIDVVEVCILLKSLISRAHTPGNFIDQSFGQLGRNHQVPLSTYFIKNDKDFQHTRSEFDSELNFLQQLLYLSTLL